MKTVLAKSFRVRCGYCGKVVRSNEKGELICAYNRDILNKIKKYMELYEIEVEDSDKIIHMVGYSCPYCGTNIVQNVDIKKAKYK